MVLIVYTVSGNDVFEEGNFGNGGQVVEFGVGEGGFLRKIDPNIGGGVGEGGVDDESPSVAVEV